MALEALDPGRKLLVHSSVLQQWGKHTPSLSCPSLAFCQRPLKSNKEARHYGMAAPFESPGQVAMITGPVNAARA